SAIPTRAVSITTTASQHAPARGPFSVMAARGTTMSHISTGDLKPPVQATRIMTGAKIRNVNTWVAEEKDPVRRWSQGTVGPRAAVQARTQPAKALPTTQDQ